MEEEVKTCKMAILLSHDFFLRRRTGGGGAFFLVFFEGVLKYHDG